MCEERRATIQMTTMEHNGSSKTILSLNLNRVHILLSILLTLIGILGGCRMAGQWIKSAVRDEISDEIKGQLESDAMKALISQEFKDQLDIFHEKAQPAIMKSINSLDVRIDALEERREANAAKLDFMAEQLGRLNDRVDILIQRIPPRGGPDGT
jgi:hypothetical protein